MSAVRLLVLGAVHRRGKAHGYQVRADLEAWAAHEWSNAASGSVYHALKAMSREGLLRAHEAVASDAGGPPRTEYDVPEEGGRTYRYLLGMGVVVPDPDRLYRAFADDLRKAYGKVPVPGIPRLTRPGRGFRQCTASA